jgi:transcriptional regulator with XRE-family HTH domain
VESIYAVVGGKIQKLRELHSLTQQELAEKSNLSVPFVSQIETGKKKASLETYSKLANGFGIELWELFIPPQNSSGKPLTLKHLGSQQRRLLDVFLKSLENSRTKVVRFSKNNKT